MALLTLDGSQTQTPTPAPNLLTAPAPFAPQPTAPQVQPQSAQTAQPSQGGLDPKIVNLAKAIRQTESGGNFQAQGKSGEYGAYQFMPDTWNGNAPRFGVNVPLQQATPQQQNEVAVKQLSEWAQQHPDWNVGNFASAWNAGPGRPNAYQENHTGTNSQGVQFDTPGYAKKVATAYQQFKGQTQQTQATGQENDPNALPTYGATFGASPDDNLFVGGLKALGNIPSSVYGLGAGLVNVALHPIDTAKNLGSAAIGGAENLTGANQGNPDQYQQVANNFGHAIMQRYGSLDALKNTLINDPAGAALDIATLVTGGEGLAAKGADLADLAAGTGKASVAAKGAEAYRAGTAGSMAMPQYGQYGTAVRSSIDTMNQTALSTLGKIASPVTALPRALVNATLGGGANEEALAAAGRTSVELPAAAYTKNSIVRSAEAIAATGAGEAAYTARVDKALQNMNNLADKIVASTGGETDLQNVGTSIVKGTEALAKAHDEAISELYKGLEAKAGDVAARADTTLRTLDKILADQEKIGETNGVGYFKNKVAVLSGAKTDEARIVPIDGEGNVTEAIPKGKQYAPPTFSTLKQVRTAIGQKIKTFNDPLATTNKQQLIQLYASLSQDMRHTLLAQKGGEELAATWDKANLAFGDNMDIVSSQYAKTIRRLAKNGQEDKILSALFKPSMSANDIPRILELAGPEGAANIRASFTKYLLDSARDATTGDFTAGKIDKALAKYGDEKIGAILEPKQIQQIKDLGTLSDAMKEIIQLKKGASTNFLVRTALSLKTLGEPAALAYAGYKLLSGDVAGGTSALLGVVGYEGLSRFLASDIGNRVLQLGAQHGSEFAKMAESQGLTPPQPLGTMDANGIPNSNRGSTGGISPDGGSISGSPRTGGGASPNLGKSSTPSLEELAKQKNFDLQGAKLHGYSDAEIQDILNPKAEGAIPKSTEAGATTQPPQTTPISEPLNTSPKDTMLSKVQDVFKKAPGGYIKNPLAQKADTSGPFDGQTFYHGSDAKFDNFDFKKTGLASGEKPLHGLEGAWFVDNKAVASGYGKNIKEARIDTSNFHTVDAKGKTLNDFRDELWDAKKLVKDQGKDGLIVKNLIDNADYSKGDIGTHIFVVNKNAIKSDNITTWDKSNSIKTSKAPVAKSAPAQNRTEAEVSSGTAKNLPASATSPSIPKELEPLAAEAKKYKSAEEFAGKMNDSRIMNPQFEVVTQSPEFRTWFAKSKLIDPAGNIVKTETPTVFYHRSSAEFDNFLSRPELAKKGVGVPDYRDTDSGFYFSRNDAGSYYGDKKYSVALRVENPKRVRGDISSISDAQIQKLKAQGYDAIESPDEIVIFDQKQIWPLTRNGEPIGKTKSQLTDFYNKVKGESKK